MRFLLILLLALFQDNPTSQLIEDLDNDNPVVRDQATQRLIEREKDIDKYKTLYYDTSNPEVKWRLKQIVQAIEKNQKFRSMATLAPSITLKFEGTAEEAFAKLAEITQQKFDSRAFGSNKVKIDVTDAPLFKVLDLISRQIGYEWIVGYNDPKGDRMNNAVNGLEIGLSGPVVNYTSVVELCAAGFSDKTPNHTTSGFKMQVVSTNFGIVNKFGEVVTELAIMYKFAAEPGLKYAIGPKITYNKILTDQGLAAENRSPVSKIALIAVHPTTKSISVTGRARYRVPLKVENIVIKDINTAKDGELTATDNANFLVKIENQRIQIHARGDDNIISERFTGKVILRRPSGDITFGGDNNICGYISTYPDYFEIYFYGSATSESNTLEFEYVTEYRDMVFDFAIDNIPLY